MPWDVSICKKKFCKKKLQAFQFRNQFTSLCVRYHKKQDDELNFSMICGQFWNGVMYEISKACM